MTFCAENDNLLCNTGPGSELCAHCGFSQEERERRRAAIRSGEMVRGDDGLLRLIVHRHPPADVENEAEETAARTGPEDEEKAEPVFLCRPCMEGSGAKLIRGNNKKDTCTICGKRRYGYLCEVKK